jgi:CheY-like chemotaxis protein
VRVEASVQAGEIPMVSGDEAGLGKVISQLIVNGSEAMPEGGTITITTEVAGNPAGEAISWVRLTVSDTGLGMSEEERRRAFEPFFTTKGPRVGQGMGLSAAYGIVLRHQGRIEVDSEAGKGTRFTVWLPALRPEPSPSEPSDTGEGPDILVIDDDEKARELLFHALRPLRVEVATDGEKGLDLFNRRRHRVVLTDLGMPGLNGWDVAKAIRRSAPETRVFLITAWDVTMSPEQLSRIGVEEILRKPFDLDRIRRVLGAVPSSQPPGGSREG